MKYFIIETSFQYHMDNNNNNINLQNNAFDSLTPNVFVLAKYYMQQCSINCVVFQRVYTFSNTMYLVLLHD